MQTEPNRLGFRYPHNPSESSLQDLERWLSGPAPLEPGFLLLQSTAERAVPEAMIRRITDHGIVPLVHIDVPIGALRPAELNSLLYSYAHWGVRYALVYDRPNMKDSWDGNGWNREALVERYLDAILPILQAQFSAGMVPILSPLQPGGDYWDTAFLRSALKGIARRGQRDLLESLAITAHAETRGKPLDWGAGGHAQWPAARPYFTPDESQDQIGFHVFDWYQQIAQEIVGTELPILAVTTGASVNESGAAQINAAVARKLHDRSQFQPLIAAVFERVPPPDQRQEWLAVPAPTNSQQTEPTEAEAKNSPAGLQTTKVLDHYLLLPQGDQVAVPAWRSATAFALTHQPVVGFSPAEAAMAKQVTIAGGVDVISEEIEALLSSAGCVVQRVTLLPQRKSACQCPSPAPTQGS